MSVKKRFLSRAVQIIGPILFVVIFIRFIDLEVFLSVIRGISIHYLVLSFFLTVLMHIGKIYRLYFLLRRQDVLFGFPRLAGIYAYGNVIGQLTNMIVSDVTHAGLLMMDSTKRMKISHVIIVNRLVDLAAVMLLFGFFLGENFRFIKPYITIRGGALLFIPGLLFAVLAIGVLFRARLLPYVSDFLASMKGSLSGLALVTVFIYGCYCLSAVCDAKAVGLGMPTSFLLLNYTLGSMITVLPISIAGIGTRDVAFVFLMGLVQISSERAVIVSFLGFVLVPLFSVLFVYLMASAFQRYGNSHHH
jgi:glycosyltransferase 2 family protein